MRNNGNNETKTNGQKRISDFGINIGTLKKGPLNKITDVAGVTVGHSTIEDENHRTGVTVINPSSQNIFLNKLVAAVHVINGFGKSTGLVQIQELGQLESPILMTNTLNVGKVQDELVGYMLEKTREEGVEIESINTVITECNDSSLNKIGDRPVGPKHVREAFRLATADFMEGDVGGGKGMSRHQLKGGIGSASRVFSVGGKEYTLGVLVQSNYGMLEDLQIDGRKVGKEIKESLKVSKNEEYKGLKVELGLEETEDKGSIIMIVATDLPVSSRQLERILRRAGNGLARVGSYMGHGSGEIVVGFSTGNIIKHSSKEALTEMKIVREDMLNPAFRASVEATEEAILNSMITANTVTGYNGNKKIALKELWR